MVYLLCLSNLPLIAAFPQHSQFIKQSSTSTLKSHVRLQRVEKYNYLEATLQVYEVSAFDSVDTQSHHFDNKYYLQT